jgi:hypothetical protein
MVQSQSRQKVHTTTFQPIAEHDGLCLSSQAMQEVKIRRIMVPGQSREKFVDPRSRGDR